MRLFRLISVLALLSGSVAFAEKHAWKAGDGPGPTSGGSSDVVYDDGKAEIPWSESEGISVDGFRSNLYFACNQLNTFLGSEISCSFDKPSAQNFYNKIANKKALEREAAGSPSSLVSTAIGCFSDHASAVGSIIYSYLKHDKADPKGKALAEFKSKVKLINVKFIDGKKGVYGGKEANEKATPYVELVGTTLVLHIKPGDDGIGHGCSWINRGTLTAFPALKKNYDQYN